MTEPKTLKLPDGSELHEGDELENTSGEKIGCIKPHSGRFQFEVRSSFGDIRAKPDGSITSGWCSCFYDSKKGWPNAKKYLKVYCPHKKPGNIMTKLNAMMKRLLDKDTQMLIKVGYINGDLELTNEGQKALMGLIFETNKAALVGLAVAELEEAEEK